MKALRHLMIIGLMLLATSGMSQTKNPASKPITKKEMKIVKDIYKLGKQRADLMFADHKKDSILREKIMIKLRELNAGT